MKAVLVRNKGVVTYDLVMHELSYLNQVVNETLRKYPDLTLFGRKCEMIDGNDGHSLKPYGDFRVTNGMPVMFQAFAMCTDLKFFPNLRHFDPEIFPLGSREALARIFHSALVRTCVTESHDASQGYEKDKGVYVSLGLMAIKISYCR